MKKKKKLNTTTARNHPEEEQNARMDHRLTVERREVFKGSNPYSEESKRGNWCFFLGGGVSHQTKEREGEDRGLTLK